MINTYRPRRSFSLLCPFFLSQIAHQKQQSGAIRKANLFILFSLFILFTTNQPTNHPYPSFPLSSLHTVSQKSFVHLQRALRPFRSSSRPLVWHGMSRFSHFLGMDDNRYGAVAIAIATYCLLGMKFFTTHFPPDRGNGFLPNGVRFSTTTRSLLDFL